METRRVDHAFPFIPPFAVFHAATKKIHASVKHRLAFGLNDKTDKTRRTFLQIYIHTTQVTRSTFEFNELA